MRFGLLVLGVGVGLGILHGWLAHTSETALSDEARVAIELRCEGREGHAARECRRLLERLYLAGTLDPERTLRAYCTLSTTVAWGARRPAPPSLCVERYSGWYNG